MKVIKKETNYAEFEHGLKLFLERSYDVSYIRIIINGNLIFCLKFFHSNYDSVSDNVNIEKHFFGILDLIKNDFNDCAEKDLQLKRIITNNLNYMNLLTELKELVKKYDNSNASELKEELSKIRDKIYELDSSINRLGHDLNKLEKKL